MGKGFNLAAVPVEEVPTLLLFATGSGIAPIRALIDSERLQVRKSQSAELNESTSHSSMCLCQRCHPRQSRFGKKHPGRDAEPASIKS